MNGPNPRKTAAMKARYAALRTTATAKMRELLAVTPTATSRELAQLLDLHEATVRIYARAAGIKLTPGKKGPKPGHAGPRASPSPELVAKRAKGIAATAAKKREAVLEKLRAALAADPQASNRELAQRVGVSVPTAAKLLHAAGLRAIQVRPAGTDLTPALEAYRSGKRRDDVCREFHVGSARLMAAVRAAGIPLHRRPGRPPGCVNKVTADAVVVGTQENAKVAAAVKGALFRLVRLADNAVLSAGPTRRACEGQAAVINAYGLVAEIRGRAA